MRNGPRSRSGRGLASLLVLLLAALVLAPAPASAQSPPGPVASVSLSRGDGTVTADWPAVAGAAKYHVTYTVDGGASWHAPVDGHTNIATNTLTFDADNAKTYIVAVRAGNDVGWGGWRNSPAAGPYTPPTPPAAPTGLTATAGDGSLTLSWDDPGDSSITGYEYNVNHNDTSTGNLSGWSAWQTIAGSGADTTGHTIDGLTNGREYRYHLRAVNGDGPGAAAPDASPWFVSATPAPPSLSAVNTTDNGATLQVGSWSQQWYYRQESVSADGAGGAAMASAQAQSQPSCVGPVQGEQADIGGLDPDSRYTYGAYVDGQCSAGIAGAQFSTLPTAPAKVDKPTVVKGDGGGTVTWTALTSNVTGYQLQYRPCVSNYNSIGSEGCAWRHSSASPWQSGWAPWNSGNWGVLRGSAGQEDSVTSPYTLTGMVNGVYAQVRVRAVNAGSNATNYGEWSDASDDFLPNETPSPHLAAKSVTGTGATLEISHHTGAWWYKQTKKRTYNETATPPAWQDATAENTCHSVASGTTTAALTGLSAYTHYTYKAYSAANCPAANEIAKRGFTTPRTLTAGDITATTATLTLSGRTGNWWIKRTKPTTGSCTAGESDFSHALSTLTAGTAYTYEAYSNNTCTTLLATESFTTAVTVSSLSNTRSGALHVGKYVGVPRKVASQFTTGANSSGYNLSSITIDIDAVDGSPGDLTVAIYSDSGNRPSSAVTTLSGSNPTEAGQYTFACSSSCTLSANTKYHLLLEAPNASGTSDAYRWSDSNSNSEVTSPSGNGWSIGESFGHYYGSWNDETPYVRYEVAAVPRPSLSVGSVTTTSATLQVSNYTGAWYYWANNGYDIECPGPVTSTSKVISGLEPGTSYTYKAYRPTAYRGGCRTEIGTVTFTTSS